MTEAERIDKCAQRRVEEWLSDEGFIIDETWDALDPNCCRDFGPHRVYTFFAEIDRDKRADVLTDELRSSLCHDLMGHNKKSAIKINFYGLDIYDNPYGTFLYVKVYN